VGIAGLVLTVVAFALALVTGTMSLHLVNAAARLVTRINTTLLQPWAEPTTARADAYAAAVRPAVEPAAPATESAAPAASEAAAPTTATVEAVPFAERARRAAADFTDKVQEITDELSERARSAARAWNQPASTGVATAATPAEAAGPDTQSAATSAGVAEEGSPDGEGADAGIDAEGPARVTVDVAMRIVTVNGDEVELTPKEFDLIVLFVQNPGRPFSRDELLDRIWRNDYEVTDRTIDTHIQRLRKKMGGAAELIQTVWGVGYKYQPPRD
jgi:hypothetical protein